MSRKKRYNTKKGLFNRSLVRLVAAAVFIGCTVLLFATERDCHVKEEQVAVIQAKLEKCEAENDELQRVLESDDKNAYMEKIALEEYGYAYTDEHRFYDITRD